MAAKGDLPVHPRGGGAYRRADGPVLPFRPAFRAFGKLLIGSVISSTDAASVFFHPAVQKAQPQRRDRFPAGSGKRQQRPHLLYADRHRPRPDAGGRARSVVWLLFSQIVLGLLAGGLVAFLAVFVLRRVRFSTDGFDVLFVVAAAVLSYALASAVGGNGYLSAYLAGILLGNSRIPNKKRAGAFFDGITGLSQIVIFFLLGLLAFPSQMPAILLPSVAIALFLTFVSRPAVVFAP